MLELCWASHPSIKDVLQGSEAVSELPGPPPGAGEEMEGGGDYWDSANSSPGVYEEMESDWDEVDVRAGSTAHPAHQSPIPLERYAEDHNEADPDRYVFT